MLTINCAFLIVLDSGLNKLSYRLTIQPRQRRRHLTPSLAQGQPTPRFLEFDGKLTALRHVVAAMEKPTDLNKYRKRSRKERGSGNTLCRSGFHKWVDDGGKQFDVKQGRLVSRQRCQRCDATRVNVS